MIRTTFLRRGPTEPPGFDPAAVPVRPTDGIRRLDGREYRCRSVESSDGTWTLAFGRPAGGSAFHLFRIRAGRVVDHRPVSRPITGAISNDGTVALVRGTESAEVGATLEVFGRDEPLLSRRFDAVLGRPSIRADGDRVAVPSRPPASTVHLFDVPSADERGAHSVPGRTPSVLGFHGDDSYLYLGVGSTDPHVAIDAAGDVVWGCDRYWETRPLRERVGSLATALRP